jgi:hypothetical protein
MRTTSTTQGDWNGTPQPALADASSDSGSYQGEQSLAASHAGDDGSSMIPKGNSYHTQFPDPDWHQIAERAADEKDPKKLAFLIKALCDRLEELRQSKFPDKK